jgi:hypothetical protein
MDLVTPLTWDEYMTLGGRGIAWVHQEVDPAMIQLIGSAIMADSSVAGSVEAALLRIRGAVWVVGLPDPFAFTVSLMGYVPPLEMIPPTSIQSPHPASHRLDHMVPTTMPSARPSRQSIQPPRQAISISLDPSRLSPERSTSKNQTYRKYELQTMCRQNDIPTSGLKDDLVHRLERIVL